MIALGSIKKTVEIALQRATRCKNVNDFQGIHNEYYSLCGISLALRLEGTPECRNSLAMVESAKNQLWDLRMCEYSEKPDPITCFKVARLEQ